MVALAAGTVDVRVLDPAGRGQWRANRDFNLRQLHCQKGEPLPRTWQNTELIDYLQRTFGVDCVTLDAPAGAARFSRRTTARAEKSGKKKV